MPTYPISFSIPESKIVGEVPKKTKHFSSIIPNDTRTYTFDCEEDYRKEYQSSVFGLTRRKAGWDCFRHYEILANGCIPFFENIENCPGNTLTHFPKELVKEAMKSTTPKLYIPRLLEHTRNHLSCRAMAQYVFDSVGVPTPKRVLFLGSNILTDYLRCLTLIGMKQILGDKCVDSFQIPHIYEDYDLVANGGYGRGFNYTRILPVSAKSEPLDLNDIYTHSFDLVVYGSIHRGLPHWDLVTRFYKQSEIILLCGEDLDGDGKANHHTCLSFDDGFHKFVREYIYSPTQTIVQIGTNTGNDHVLKLAKALQPAKVYLVEPFTFHNTSIREHYAGIQNVVLDNIAITPTSQESVQFYYSEQDGPSDSSSKSYMVASIVPEHIIKHYTPKVELKSVSVPAMTLNDYFQKYKLTVVDYLFLDIEGIDFEVLESIDFSKVDIRHLQIEHLHLDKSTLIQFMKHKGYSHRPGLDTDGYDTLFIKS